MSTTVTILSTQEQRRFDLPPSFDREDRQVYFEPSETVRRYLRHLRTPENKVSFVLQYGYFKARGRFFEPHQFRPMDIKYIYRAFGLTRPKKAEQPEHFETLFGGASSSRHRKKILELSRWTAMGEAEHRLLLEHADFETQKQTGPEEMFYALVSYCWKNRFVIPSYSVLSQIVSRGYQRFEAECLSILQQHLSDENRRAIEGLLEPGPQGVSRLAEARKLEHSTRNQGLRKSALALREFGQLYFSNEPVFERLGLTDQAAEYYANWIIKAKTFQVNQFADRNKAYLYLLAFIKVQYYRRQDAAMEAFMKRVRQSLNKAKKKALDFEKETIQAKNKAIDAVASAERALTEFVGEIIRIADDSTLSDIQVREIIRNRALGILGEQDEEFLKKVNFLKDHREKEKLDSVRVDALEDESRGLQLAVAELVTLLVFDKDNSDRQLVEAIEHFQTKDRNIGENPPTSFLKKSEKGIVFKDGIVSKPLYKMFLFRAIFDGIKSGKLSLKYSFNFRALRTYMIDDLRWDSQKHDILDATGLLKYSDCSSYLKVLEEALEGKFRTVNERFAAGNNGYLMQRPNGRFHVKTPAIDFEKSKYISAMLASEGEKPILQVQREVDRICNFTKHLSHHSNKNVVKDAEPQILIAAIMALGCNIGPRRMANMSIGISEAKLLDTINWRFSPKNLTKINSAIVDTIKSLDLPNIYTIEDDCIFSSSDGKKITVAVDSLLANYSFKYFGRDKGVAVYSFIDDKQSLFHSTVISPTDREAIYVVDGLLHNTTSIHHIHSTDTHGFTEAVFAATHLIDVAFAPRFKRIEDQTLYSFATKASHLKEGRRILPSRKIDVKVIEENWDDVLRFMATIKSGYTTASQLFQRLNSYAKDHPLYRALKEFGRVLKSIHILTVYDDLEFRQRIQKQLNRVELSNKFSDAVFWDRGKQLHVSAKEEQEKYILCKTILQNSIILWNYLFLSDRLLSTGNPQDKADMIDSVMKGSVLAWRHINFTGEYDFTKPSSKDFQFNFDRIRKLRVPKPEPAPVIAREPDLGTGRGTSFVSSNTPSKRGFVGETLEESTT